MVAELTTILDSVDYFYARVFRDWPSAVTRENNDYTFSFSGDTRLTGANHLWLRHPDALTPQTLHDARAFFEHFRAAWSVVVIDTFIPQASALLHDRGFFVRWDSPLMVLDGLAHRLPIHTGVEVQRATTPRHLSDIIFVMAEAFATNDNVNRRVVRNAQLGDAHIQHYVIYTEGQPAACATVARHNGTASIWNVGTRLRFRRQGLATTIMHAILDDLAAEGITTTILMATRAGLPLYNRLGYRRVGTTAYMGPPLFQYREG